MNFWKNIWKKINLPTPKKWKQIGKAFIAVNGFLATFTMLVGWSHWIAIGALVTGAIGYFITALFTEKETEKSTEE
jgi:hypothetical protein